MGKENDLRIIAHWEPRYQQVGLFITGDKTKAEPITMSPMKERFESIEPCLQFDDPKELQELMDSLWCMGLRPSARSDEYKAQLNTMRNHLNDMRALVFTKNKREELK